MDLPPNLGLNIYRIRIFNREIKVMNARMDIRKMIEIPLSNLEILYIYLYGAV